MKHILGALLILWPAFVSAAEKQFDSRAHEGSVHFVATASPGNVKIEGKIPEEKAKAFQWVFRLKEGKLHFVSKLQMNVWDTGIALRNSHLAEKYLEAAKHPEARLKLDPIPAPASGERSLASSSQPFTGELQMHGHTRKIKGQYEAKVAGKNTQLVFEFPVRLGDFKIAVPSFMGVSVAEEVKLTAKFSLPL